MNLKLVEEAFLEDLYDDRRKLRVELPTHGFVLYAAPTSSPKSIWQISLASEAVASVYTQPRITTAELARLSEMIRVRNVSSASIRKTLGEHRNVRVVSGDHEARTMMLHHIVEWIGDNFGVESRPSAEKCARDALTLVRNHSSFVEAKLLAEKARRWFPTFHEALTKEVDRALGA